MTTEEIMAKFSEKESILPMQREGRATEEQIGGNHYKEMAIQPIEFITKNNIPYMEGNIIKYICRHRNKNKAEDIKKIIHYCKLILELEYNEK